MKKLYNQSIKEADPEVYETLEKCKCCFFWNKKFV